MGWPVKIYSLSRSHLGSWSRCTIVGQYASLACLVSPQTGEFDRFAWTCSTLGIAASMAIAYDFHPEVYSVAKGDQSNYECCKKGIAVEHGTGDQALRYL